jgi:hypothetical protein
MVRYTRGIELPFFLVFGRVYPTFLGVGYSTTNLGLNLSLFSKGMGFFVLTLTNFTNHESRVTIHGNRGTSEQLKGEGV